MKMLALHPWGSPNKPACRWQNVRHAHALKGHELSVDPASLVLVARA